MSWGSGICYSPFMRFLNSLAVGLALALAGGIGLCGLTAEAGNVAGTWHFAGSAQLTNNPDFDNVDKIFTMAPSGDFRNYILDRFAGWLNKWLFASTMSNNASLLRPLLDDLLSAETVWALGGTRSNSPDFIVALRLDDGRAQAWQAVLPKLAGGPGQAYQAQKFDGKQWNLASGESLWAVRVKSWLLVGRGKNLVDTMGEYLAQIGQNDHPAPPLNKSWLEADLDWAQLARWLPEAPHVLLAPRTKVVFTAGDHTLYVNASISYPNPIPWKFEDWRIPTNLIRDPLISFTAGQDIAAYMSPNEPLSKLTDNPLAGQYFVWSLGDLVFRTHAAWPVADATNTIKRIGAEAPAAFNPALKEMGAGELRWQPERNALAWENVGPFIVPDLQVAPETNGQYLAVSLFPLINRGKPAPDELWQQITGHTNMVYYDWEDTGSRLGPWQTLGAILPVLPRLELPLVTNNPGTTNRQIARALPTPVVVDENWLNGLRPFLTHRETITLITRVSPTELKLVRQSPFVVTSLELVLLSHWLSGTASPGINTSMLPPRAKVTGPGIPSKSP